MLNWSEVAEMSRNGVSFGAHTLSHPFLPALPLDQAKDEILASKQIIEAHLRTQVKHFAIPNGQPADFNKTLTNFCREIGFHTIVTTVAGVVDQKADLLSLRRVCPPPPLYYFACELFKYFFLAHRTTI
jgi:peptidoglycan/xylan/chitin deacetylase (PgdA/CDA1 family)